MLHLIRIFIAAMCSVLFGVELSAGVLDWNLREQEIHADAFEKTVRFTADYINLTDDPIVITKIKTTCGCTTISNELPISVTPESSGSIDFDVELGNRQGRRVIAVEITGTSGDVQTVKKLNLKVVSPRLINLKPALLRWEDGGREMKSARLVISDGIYARIVVPEQMSQQFGVTLVRINSHEYRLKVKPGSIEGRLSGSVIFDLISVDDEKDKRSYKLHLLLH